MSKILDASCEAGVVTVEGVELDDVTILGEGVGQSLGVLLLDGVKKTYIPKTSPDLDATLEQAIAGLEAAASGLSGCVTALNTIGAAAGIPGPALALLVAPITLAAGNVTAAKSALEDLKGELR